MSIVDSVFWVFYATTYDVLPISLPSYQDTLNRACLKLMQRIPSGGDVLDGSPAMLTRAVKKPQCRALSIDLQLSDLDARLAFHDSAFDAALSVMVLYALEDPSSFLRELRLVTRQQGTLVLVTTDDRPLFLPGAKEIILSNRFPEAIWRLGALVGVGAVNAIIDRRLRRQYTGSTEAALTAHLEAADWCVEHIERCYVDG